MPLLFGMEVNTSTNALCTLAVGVGGGDVGSLVQGEVGPVPDHVARPLPVPNDERGPPAIRDAQLEARLLAAPLGDADDHVEAGIVAGDDVHPGHEGDLRERVGAGRERVLLPLRCKNVVNKN